MFELSKVDNFPELTRSGRVSDELQGIIDALLQSASNGDRFAISGVHPDKPYNSLQQRIRAQAKKHNLKVIIRYDADDLKLYFKASPMGLAKNPVARGEEVISDIATDATTETSEVKTSDVKGIKSKATAK